MPYCPTIPATSSEKGYEKTGNNGSDETLLRGHAACYTECDCQRKGNDADNDTGNQIRHKGLLIVVTFLEQPEKFGLEYFFQVNFHTTIIYYYFSYYGLTSPGTSDDSP